MIILSYRFTGGGDEVLILGGVHGDEIEGVIAAQKILEILMKSFPYRLNLTLVPQFNPRKASTDLKTSLTEALRDHQSVFKFRLRKQ